MISDRAFSGEWSSDVPTPQSHYISVAYIPGLTRLLGFKQSAVCKVPGKRDELVEELLGKKRDELVSLPRSSKDAGSVEEQTDGQLLAVHSP
ncbi:hypothetical protein CEXT_337341 [Caerostris extrusa]|uniref:Uncharacterized protein n=1 Tax=Caerostris extrusa TaxID=172846 RepID=A0AAV4NG91_CAEEX|nr:hypothetical protein CEXT_337341 [Caerostris extrusa]